LKENWWNVYDENDENTGIPVASGIAHIFGLRHRSANAFVLGPDGEVVLQRRAE